MTLLENYLREQRITQAMIARQAGKPISSINRVINSAQEITAQNNISTIRAIAKILKVTPGDVLNQLIELERKTMAFYDNHSFYLLTTIWNKDQSIFSDESVKYDSLTEALDDIDKLVKTNKLLDRITYDLSATDEDANEYILLSIELENNQEKIDQNFVDNLDILPENLQTALKKVAAKHSITI